MQIRAAIGIYPFGGSSAVRDSVVEADPESTFFNGANINSSNGAPETQGGLVAVNVTIVGNGQPGSIGIVANGNEGDSVGQPPQLDRRRRRHLACCASRRSATTSTSPSATPASTARRCRSPGRAPAPTPSRTTSTTPRTAASSTPAAGDYRLRPDSVLIDARQPGAADERNRLPRPAAVRDGNADGTAVADIGAYEYQRVPPSPAFAFAPAAPLFGDLVAFDGAGTSDVDGDPFSLAWALGDGSAATGPAGLALLRPAGHLPGDADRDRQHRPQRLGHPPGHRRPADGPMREQAQGDQHEPTG